MAREVTYLNMNSLRLTAWDEGAKHPNSLALSLNTNGYVGLTCFFSDRDKQRINLGTKVLEFVSLFKKYIELIRADEEVIHLQLSSDKKYDDKTHVEVITLGRNKVGLCYIIISRDEAQSPPFKFIMARGCKLVQNANGLDNREASKLLAISWARSVIDQLDIGAALLDGKNVRASGGADTISGGGGSGSTSGGSTELQDFEDDIPF